MNNIIEKTRAEKVGALDVATFSNIKKERNRTRYRNCEQCHGVGSIQVLEYYCRGDFVVCQKCGAGYLLKSRRPFNLKFVAWDYD